MTSEKYLALLRERLADGYDVETARYLGGRQYPLYARSRVLASKYILSRSWAYERMEINEHVVFRVYPAEVTPGDVSSFVGELKNLVAELVKPSYEHMSSALTGVLVAERGFTPEAARMVTRSSFTKSFWFGLRGWCFLRLLGVDLTAGKVWANRRGKEVMDAYSPGTA